MKRFITATLAAIALISTTACSAPPKDLDVSLTHPSVQKKYVVTLEPPVTQAPINQLHSWKVRVVSQGGAPVTQARIKVDGGMPQHGHGLPTRPRVTQELPGGTYVIDGMKFSMTGWWEIKLTVEGSEGTDEATFNTVVLQPSAAR
jgi:hypothetical protein